MLGPRLIDELAPLRRELHEAPAPVFRIREPADETHLLKTVETVRHRTRRQDHGVEERRRVHSVRRTSAPESRKDEILAPREAMAPEDLVEADRLEQVGADDPLKGVRRRRIQVRTHALPLAHDPIYFVFQRLNLNSTSRFLTRIFMQVSSYRSTSLASRGFSMTEFTQVERQVLELLARGYDNRAIAAELELEYPAVGEQVRSVIAKLGARSRVDAVARAFQRGLVSRPES
jgi:DNA-binding CsgD family transcriptional regulator